MPPKQKSKADLAKKQKIIEDKTFGLKNKNKSKNVQKYVQSLKQSVEPKPDASKLNAQELFKVAIKQPKVPVGVDPKSIVCEHFKVGQCAKGFKCKFSHDLNVQRKGEKIDIYSDKRDEDENGTMEDWDQETLEKVVASKSNEYNKNKPTDIVSSLPLCSSTEMDVDFEEENLRSLQIEEDEGPIRPSSRIRRRIRIESEVSRPNTAQLADTPRIRIDGVSVAYRYRIRIRYAIRQQGGVCKYFLEAVEKKQYGWFWACPNGGKECHYRHALPPGYILKSQMKALLEEESKKVSIEEEIENERAKIATTTPMTPELFMQWKMKKIEARDASLAAERADRAKNDRMRHVFLNASIFVDDAEAYDKYQREDESDVDQKVNKDAPTDRPSSSTSTMRSATDHDDDNNGDVDGDDDDLDMDELNELEASLSKTSLEIKEPADNM
ncbi:hypothetical protein SASPL_155224 [Salvia splendens]|uniref:C3H1-type domain-containing protein n=1 Tax=Salvia splendens TaxID=180675 RepID=A0A8X8W1M0_SALSN|nr:hypothetical protein SASPL_155224 [Salvia splendens]